VETVEVHNSEAKGKLKGHLKTIELNSLTYSKKNMMWRDKLAVNYTMDSVELLDHLEKFFNEVKSFVRDPDNPAKPLSTEETYTVRILIDRAINWMITQIVHEQIPPIKLTLLSSNGEHKDIVDALSDDRNMGDVKQLITQAKNVDKDDLYNTVYLTPQFLENFDFEDIDDRLYLRSKIRFKSALLGFQSRVYSNRVADEYYYTSSRCMIGSSGWHRKKQTPGMEHP